MEVVYDSFNQSDLPRSRAARLDTVMCKIYLMRLINGPNPIVARAFTFPTAIVGILSSSPTTPVGDSTPTTSDVAGSGHDAPATLTGRAADRSREHNLPAPEVVLSGRPKRSCAATEMVSREHCWWRCRTRVEIVRVRQHGGRGESSCYMEVLTGICE